MIKDFCKTENIEGIQEVESGKVCRLSRGEAAYICYLVVGVILGRGGHISSDNFILRFSSMLRNVVIVEACLRRNIAGPPTVLCAACAYDDFASNLPSSFFMLLCICRSAFLR